MLQEGGIFEGMEINAHEQSPKDIWMMKIFEEDYESVMP